MTYVSTHPYACTNVMPLHSTSQHLNERPKRPTIATRGIHSIPEEYPLTYPQLSSARTPTSSTNTVSPTSRAGPSLSLSPSPITFARASFISIRRGSDESTITGVNLHDDNGEHDRDDNKVETSTTRTNMMTPVAQNSSSSMGVIAAALSRSSPSALDRAAKQNEEARQRLSNFLQRASEVSPRVGPACSFAPSLVVPERSPGGDSVTLTIEGVSVELDFPRPPSAGPISPSPSYERLNRQEQTPRCRSRSPTTSPSTPGFPLTPASSEDGFVLPAVAPLSISKPRSPSPSASASSSCAGSPSQSSTLAQHASKPRIASRRTNKNAKRLSRLFTNGPTPLDTAAANRLARAIQDQSEAEPSLTLTGVLAEVAEEAARAKQAREEAEAYSKLQSEQKVNESAPVLSILNVDPADSFEEEPIPKGASSEAEVDDEMAWIDVDVDDEEGRDYYRSDIATHLQLFSSVTPFAPGASLHRRGSSSTSSILRQQFPPARPDSMPLPPHARIVLPTIFDGDEGDVPPVPTLPSLSPCASAFANNTSAYGRRGSAASLASNSSVRSTGSQKSGRGGSSSNSNRRHSRARVSASVNVGRRRRGSSSASLTVPGGNGSRMKSLPPTPTSAGSSTGAAPVRPKALGPSAMLDPTFSLAPAPTRVESSVKDKPTRPPRLSRPPPRFSLPIDVAGDDEEFLSPLASRPRRGLNMGALGLSSMLEVDEEQHGSVGSDEGRHPFARPEPLAPSKVVSLPTSANAKASPGRSPRSQVASLTPLPVSSSSPSTLLFVPSSPVTPVSVSPEQTQFAPFAATSKASASNDSIIDISFDKTVDSKNDNYDNNTTNDDTDSVFHDGEGRILRSRWSTSTFASTAITPGPNTGRSATGSATRQFFPRLPSLPTALQLPSRLKRSNANSGSPRNSGERERPSFSRPSIGQRSATADPPQVLPFPFFPTPTPPSPKRANNPGPGKYVPKPELRPPPREPRESSDSTASTIKARVSSEGSSSNGSVQYARYRSNTATSTAQPSPALSSTSYRTSASGGSGTSSYSFHTTTSTSSSSGTSSSSARPLLLTSSPTSPDDGDALSMFPFTLSSTVSAAIGSASTSSFPSTGGADELGRNNSRSNSKGKGTQQRSPVSGGFSLGRKNGGGSGNGDRRKKELVSLRGKPVPAEILTW